MSLLLDTRFADMAVPVANRWLAWARSHDWGQNATLADGKISDCVTYWYNHDENGKEFLDECKATFSTPREMRDWAGY